MSWLLRTLAGILSLPAFMALSAPRERANESSSQAYHTLSITLYGASDFRVHPRLWLDEPSDTVMSSSEDEDLKQAIALSIRSSNNQEVINLDSDDDEAVSEASKPVEKLSMPSSSLGFLGIDRKKMEQERLARKRKASTSPPPARKITKTDESLVSRTQALQPVASPKPQTSANPGGSSSANNPKGPPLFHEGTVRKTWACGHPRTAHDIKIEEVLQKDDLALAVLSSFQWDVAWLLAKMNTNSMDESSTSDIKF